MGLSWKKILRQLLVNSGVWTNQFILGLNLGASTVLVPQMTKDNQTSERIALDEVSSLNSTFVYCSLPWVILLPMISSLYGRKICFLIVNISAMIGFVIFYCSSNLKQIKISEIFLGILLSSNTTISVFISTEYTSSAYRGIFLTLKPASFYWGVLVANTIGTLLHWKYIPMVGIISVTYCLITLYFWPESPLWLAEKGYLDKCIQAHRWLKGSSHRSERELVKFISNDRDIKQTSKKFQAINVAKALTDKNICKVLLFCLLLKLQATCSGKLICTMFALNVLKKVYSTTSTAYMSMLILDAVTVFSTYVGCGITKSFKRRTLLITFSAISTFFLFSLALYLYLIKLSVLSEGIYVSLFLLAGLSIASSCGPILLSVSIAGELLPIESRSITLCIVALSYNIVNGGLVNLFPYIITAFDMHGTFIFFAINSTICLILVYIFIPETKDKTLQEIADIVKGEKPVTEAEILNRTSTC